MLNTNAYNYINVLNKAADGAWTRNEVLANNISNATTPGFKRQDVDFDTQLKNALSRSNGKALDHKVDNLKLEKLKAEIYTDSANFSYRLDGNNVDIDTENVTLAANQLKYNGIIDSLNTEFKHLQMVMK